MPGVYRVDESGVRFFFYPVAKKIINKYLYYPTSKAQRGPDGTVWLGTMESVFGFKKDSIITVGRAELGRQKDDRQMGIRGMHADRRGVLWFADNGAGVYRFDKQAAFNLTEEIRGSREVAEVASLEKSFSVWADRSGNLWIGTAASAIWKYNATSKEYSRYDRDDGVMSEVIWTIYETSDGQLLFAGESPAAVYVFENNRFLPKF